MKENKIEKYLKTRVEEQGGICEKFVSPGRRDVPDRNVTWDLLENPPAHGKGNETVETKAPGKKPRKGQLRDHAERRKRGALVSVLDTIEKIDAWMLERFPLIKTKSETRAKKKRDRDNVVAAMKAEDAKQRKESTEPHQGKPVLVDDFADLI